MFTYAWPTVIQKMSQVLDIYPKVKGIQVMNDMGPYMFSRYAGKWIPDTPGVRFATLMHLLCRQNGGTFVGLSRLWRISTPGPRSTATR